MIFLFFFFGYSFKLGKKTSSALSSALELTLPPLATLPFLPRARACVLKRTAEQLRVAGGREGAGSIRPPARRCGTFFPADTEIPLSRSCLGARFGSGRWVSPKILFTHLEIWCGVGSSAGGIRWDPRAEHLSRPLSHRPARAGMLCPPRLPPMLDAHPPAASAERCRRMRKH